MSLRRISLVALALVLALTAFGCTSATKPAEDSSATEPAETDDAGATSAEFRDLSYLTGTWTVTTELVEIDNPAMTAAADQPAAPWAWVGAGDTRTLVPDRPESPDTLPPEAEGGWVYEASSTFTDEDGYTVTSTIAVSGKPTSTDLDAFVGGMTGTIDTPDGRLYTAQWDIEGRRQL